VTRWFHSPDCDITRDPACDKHAHCPCGGLMSFDSATGGLVCDDCRVRASADPTSWEPAEVTS
jgi:hypothetical protein